MSVWVSPTISCPGNIQDGANLYLTEKSQDIMDFNQLKAYIDNYIYTNGVKAITGSVLNDVLKQMVDVMAQSGGGGAGSVVFWNQILQSGTKIAEISINGNTTDVLAPAGGGGSAVGNLEDIDTNSQGELQFANRAASATQMGHVILRTDKTFSQQVTASNTIYEIRYAFDLGGGTFTAPANSILLFNGGKLTNGTLNGQNTGILKGLNENVFGSDLVLGLGLVVDCITPQNYGAIGDGTTDVSSIFSVLNSCPYKIFIPRGEYVVENLVISKAKEWVFERTGDATQWFTSENAVILTSTGVKVSGGPIIRNIKITYNGNASIENRPVGLTLNSHFCEIHSAHVSYFRIGVLLGGTGHCDYTKIFDLYAWYNYKAGVSVEHAANNQVNFISFFDCNVGSNGVSVHDGTIAPDITADRGYGFYFHGGNAIYVNNCDISSNEVCGICIDNQTTSYINKALVFSDIYAEHNKYCNIFFKNGEDPDLCRTQFVSMKNAYFYNENDAFFVEDVVKLYPFTPPSVDFYGRYNEIREGASTSFYQGMDNHKMGRLNDIFLIPNCSYCIKLKIKPKTTGTLVFQNVIRGVSLSSTFGYLTPFISNTSAFSVATTANQVMEFSFYITIPDNDSPFVAYLPTDYGVDYDMISMVVENMTIPSSSDVVRGTPFVGAKRNDNGNLQIFTGGDWKTIMGMNVGTADPASGAIGDYFFNTTRQRPQFWDGIKWISADGFDASFNHAGTTANRPVLPQSGWGYMYLDTDIGKPIWWMGNVWIDATGAAV